MTDEVGTLDLRSACLEPVVGTVVALRSRLTIPSVSLDLAAHKVVGHKCDPGHAVCTVGELPDRACGSTAALVWAWQYSVQCQWNLTLTSTSGRILP
eukprot:CAMPEP_0181199614 /NCGR_PEP_ID=MMETSP1096-20121128/17269_1 /TAXON_ID=156174 ORGANISM="Chrysochromulina ericina, Strain CCMP281" /NCGR_SAMPLE_ID=MMETSP1096 /ASSEMBLY_ACC=CAM_ASM_000453 /LENGTH=96 /DNA_ID=CAMNT_0023289805 /DNA_START=60 /DNA_END=351 /DNA_ORIENTATION=+